MPPDRTHSQPHEYRGIKRIQQACKNCRRKKAKCSGKRPICGYCERLSQDCQWDDAPRRMSNISNEIPDAAGNGSDPGALIYDDVLPARVAAIEAKLDQLMNTLNAFIPALESRTNPGPSILAPENNSPNAMTPDDPAPQAITSMDRSMDTLDVHTLTYDALPPPQVMSALVDVYFARVQNQPYSFFHEQTFRQRLADNVLPDHLKFAVLAAALRFSDDEYYNGDYLEATAAYARESWRLLVSSWFATESDPDIYICQSITLLSIVDFTAGRRHPAWLKIGMAIRVAQDLCLMMDPDPSLPLVDQEERRRIFWSIYLLDKFCSCGRSRVSAISDAQCRVQIPCDEVTFRNGAWKKTITLDQLLSSSSPETDHPGHLGLLILTASIIGRCARYCIHERNRGEIRLPPWDSKSDFTKIHSLLLQLETQYDMGGGIGDIVRRDCLGNNVIDMQMASPIIFSHIIFHTCQCLLNHPFLLHQQLQKKDIRAPPSFMNRASQTCREHACAISELLEETRREGCMVYSSFIGYCATVSGGVHTLFLNDEDVNIRQRAATCLQSNMKFLEEFSQYWKNGKIMCSLLQNLSAQPLSVTSLVVSSPQAEDLDAKMIQRLWESVDSTTLSQPLQPITSQTGPGTPFQGFNSLFDMGSVDLSNFGLSGFTPDQHSGQSPNPSLPVDGMSPFISFFRGTTMNFGG